MNNIKANNRGGKIFNDILVYGIGNLGSRIITFLLIPIYTFYIQPADFGYYDLSLNIIFLLMPFMTLQLRDSVFRFLIDNDCFEVRCNVISYTYKIIGIFSFIGLALGWIIQSLFVIDYFWWILFMLLSFSWYEVQIQIIRGLKKTKLFVGIGILTSFLIAMFSYVFVAVLNWGIEGIYMANILARFISLAVIEFVIPITRLYFNIHTGGSLFKNEIFKYSLPLLPNVLCWWVIGSSAAFFIKHYIGLDMNGQYGIAVKFSTIIMTLSGIFYQAWQETAINQYTKPDREYFFTRILNLYFGIMVFISLFSSFALKLFYPKIVQAEYQASAAYLFPLCVAVAFYALAVFLDMVYLCSKQTYRLLPSIVFTSILNLLLNWLGIIFLGIWGVLLSSIITWIFLFSYRIIDVRRYLRIKLNKQFYFSILQILICAFCYYYFDWLLSDLFLMIVLCIINLILYRAEIETFYNNIFREKLNKIWGRL